VGACIEAQHDWDMGSDNDLIEDQWGGHGSGAHHQCHEGNN